MNTKTCSLCGEEKPATVEFFYRKKLALRSACKACETLRTKQYRSKRREQYVASYTAYNKDRGRNYYAAHREERIAYQIKYQKMHLDQTRLYRRVHNAKRRAGVGSYSAKDVREQYARQKGLCFWRTVNPECLRQLGDKYHVDHVVPLAKGGSNSPENIVIACITCNQKKYDSHPMDFAGILF